VERLDVLLGTPQQMFTLGMLYDALCAYYIAPWQWLQFLAGAIAIPMLIIYW
jgi:hypothetical protein